MQKPCVAATVGFGALVGALLYQNFKLRKDLQQQSGKIYMMGAVGRAILTDTSVRGLLYDLLDKFEKACKPPAKPVVVPVPFPTAPSSELPSVPEHDNNATKGDDDGSSTEEEDE